MSGIETTFISAQHQVLATTELFECILLHLGAQTLLLSQRVNKSFHYTIRGSCKLRQKLWLQPGDSDHDVENPLIPSIATRTRINPFLATPWVRQHCHSHIGRIEFGEPDTSGGFLAPVLRIICRKGVSFQESPRASWRDMIVVSKHEPYFQFRIMRHSPENGNLLLWQLVFFEKSPTAGELIELALEPKSLSDLVVRKDGSRVWASTVPRLRQILQELDGGAGAGA
ncbi:hypothetical protein DOTSEDRAFT_77552 [Dothistroma septosporum NZE10]|uniref:F-box domain-containing protein n=1 Tax=Dothistroma septosporum (strain NZE10 / CBS 128990) TaxID=675120 RepID=N1PW43_DOTSN|nr:hypothetical protein DOTSEDRAFT_77552 [Dothistroma septosporum NZE10]